MSFVSYRLPWRRKQKSEPKSQPGRRNLLRTNPKARLTWHFEELKKRGEAVFSACADDCKESKKKSTSGTINGRAIHLEQPAYPALAAAAHVSGDVIVLVIIDKQGKVIAAQIVDGHPFLQAAALKASKACRFSPPLLDGKPANIMGRIVYRFVPAS